MVLVPLPAARRAGWSVCRARRLPPPCPKHARRGILAVRAVLTTWIIVKIWTTCPHVSNVAPYAETSPTDKVPYAEFSANAPETIYSGHISPTGEPAVEFGSSRESRVGFRIEARYVEARGRLPTVPNWAGLF